MFGGNGIAFANDLFVTVREKGIIVFFMNSPAGITCAQAVSGTDRTLYRITYGNGLFVAVGTGESIMTSTDAVSWSSKKTAIQSNLYSLTYGNGTFVALGDVSAISYDGVHWISIAYSSESSYTLFPQIIFANEMFISAELGKGINNSPDGINWTNIFRGYFSKYSTPPLFVGITYGEGKYVAVTPRGDYNNISLLSQR
jgi:hypothetical protein